MSKASREIAGVYATCAAVVGLMAALAPEMAPTSTGIILIAAVALSGGLLFFFILSDGLGLLRALLALLLLGSAPFGLVYGVVRFLLAYL